MMGLVSYVLCNKTYDGASKLINDVNRLNIGGSIRNKGDLR